jgi:glutathione synthase/RimK-type ligase-like ATP-grasp enzyme
MEPPTLIGNSKLATMALGGVELAPIWNTLVKRVKVNPQDAAAFLDLSTIAYIQGRPGDRALLRTRAFELSRVFRLPAAHQTADAIKALAFMSGGDYLANMPIEFFLDGSDINLDIVFVAPDLPLPQPLPEHDVAFVAVAESNENQPVLRKLAELLRHWPRPVINRPERIAPLTRDGTWSLLKSAPGLTVPINARVDRATIEKVAFDELRIEAVLEGNAFPIIVRPLDSHLGDGLCKLDDVAAVRTYLLERQEPEFYVAPFIDYRQRDGLYRKYRVALVDRQPYAVHMAVSRQWMINYVNADMNKNAEKRAEEARFMAHFDHDFAVRHADALRAIADRTGLEYLPFDCGETKDGKLLLFELGTNMIVHSMDPPDVFPYKRPQMEKVFGAFQTMLRKKSTRKQTCTTPASAGN